MIQRVGAGVRDYNIEYRVAGEAEWQVLADGTSTRRWAVVTGLTNGTRYQLRVAARNNVGTGPWSNLTAQRAGIATAPRDVRAVGGDGVIAMRWSAPKSDAGSPVTHYTVRYRADDASPWTTTTDSSWLPLRARIGGLDPDTAYDLQVAAVTARGTGVWSSRMMATTKPA